MFRITHFIKTTGVIYDDRLLKEAATLNALGAVCEIVVIEEANTVTRGNTSDGVRWRAISLHSRGWFPRARGLWIKVTEMNGRFFSSLWFGRPHMAWVHNVENLLFVLIAGVFWRPFGSGRKILWDLHELPPRFYMDGLVGKVAMRFALQTADLVVAANAARVELLLQRFGQGTRHKFMVIDNYPTREFAQRPKGQLPDKLAHWLGDSPYFLLQGMAQNDRMVMQIVEASMLFPEYRLVVLGPMDKRIARELRSLWGPAIDDKVFVSGMTPQSELYHVIDYAIVSLVFYGKLDMNRWLCAPNRLYQAVSRGIPVVCGSNPPMKSIVDVHGNGIAIEGDGSDAGAIRQALETLLSNLELYQARADQARLVLNWESQYPVFRRIVSENEFPE